MNIIENENIVCYDTDDTLVKWPDNYTTPYAPAGTFEYNRKCFTDPYDNSSNYLIPHEKHIALLKKHKGRGQFVIVWSAAGVKWAESVVKTLNLESYVDLIMTKPTKLVDDLPVHEIFPVRIYLKDIK